MADEGRTARSRALRVAMWIAALACFYLVFSRIDAAAHREGMTAMAYLGRFFGRANWLYWLSLMVPYSVFFFLVDAHATFRVIRWYNAPALKYTDVLPIRASAYILSLVNEQVSKGAMSLYLLRRYGVPVWQAVSTMIMLSMVEIYQLLIFSAVGLLLYHDLVAAASTRMPLVTLLWSVYAVAFAYFPFHLAYFNGSILERSNVRNNPLLHAFRQARLGDYILVLLFKAPNLLAAVVVYTVALSLFNVDVGFARMMAFLPVIFLAAALPLPFHAGALVLWTVLFPGFPEVGAFALVMHTFFVVFNAAIGLVFLPVANRELFIERPAAPGGASEQRRSAGPPSTPGS